MFGDNAVAVVDTSSLQVVKTIPVTAPDGMVITPDGTKVYVSSADQAVVDVIDTASDTVARSIAVGTTPQGLSISADGSHVVAAVQGNNKAAIIATASDTVVATATLSKPHSSTITSDGKTAFVASQDATTPAADLVALPGGATGSTFALDKAPRAMCLFGGKLYITVSGGANIEVVDATTGQAGTAIPTDGSPHAIFPTIDGSHILTVSQTAGELEVIDPAAASVSGKVATGTLPHWIAQSDDGKIVYVTNETDGTLAVINLATLTVTQTVHLGNAPRKLAVQ